MMPLGLEVASGIMTSGPSSVSGMPTTTAYLPRNVPEIVNPKGRPAGCR